jgi:rubrerythrin
VFAEIPGIGYLIECERRARMTSLAREYINKLLGYAMRAEIDSDRIYTEMSNRVKNPLLIQKFRMLAFEEQKHKTVLERLFQSMFPGQTPEVPGKVNPKLLPTVVIQPSSDLVDILRQAMEGEKSAQAFYLGLAKRVEPGKRKILEYLGKVEKSHYLMLRSEFTMAQQFDDYADMDEVTS